MTALEASLRARVGEGARAFALDANLSLDAGVLVLFGPSGAGKTMTLKALAGLLPAVSGHLRVGDVTFLDTARGVDVPADRRRFGYVPQHHALFPFLDVTGNVGFGLPRAERRGPKVQALLDELGLASLANAPADTLSGGERQRVALARALAIEPRLLLLDEPFASIDAEGRATLRALVREVIDRRRIPAVLVTHARDEAVALGDRVVRFERGRAVEAGDARAMLAGGAFTVRGKQLGPAEDLGDGLARVTLIGATLEGPVERVARDDGATIELDSGADDPR